jgi:uncharacterized NAD(P)/FAD-binding protein YdhS
MAVQQDSVPSLAICGGGASAVLLAQALRRAASRPLAVTIFDGAAVSGRGSAYATNSLAHLLNVPASRMSAIADDQDHFAAWLSSRAETAAYTPRSFVPRKIYGDYLKDQLAQALNDTSGPVHTRVEQARVSSLSRAIKGWQLTLADGRTMFATQAVIATGNEPPRRLPLQGPVASHQLLNDPWDEHAKALIRDDADVVLVGSGLTAIDVALELLGRGHKGRIMMLSRHGLLPRVHSSAMLSGSWLFPPYPSSVRDLMRRIRAEASRIPGLEGWRTAIDSMRPNLPAIWEALSPADRVRFLRHVRPHWEVHRHRMAPEVATQMNSAIGAGAISPEKGRLVRISNSSKGRLNLAIRRLSKEFQVDADFVVNCTGPDCNPSVSRNPLITSLLEKGIVRPDPLRLGLDTSAEERLIAADGSAHPDLYAVGPAARGRLWEVTAIPEIRTQVTRLSRLLAPAPAENPANYAI